MWHISSENVDILYRCSCILGHFKACFDVFNEYFNVLQRLPSLKKTYLFKVMQTFHNKIESKIIEYLSFCIQDIFITNRPLYFHTF